MLKVICSLLILLGIGLNSSYLHAYLLDLSSIGATATASSYSIEYDCKPAYAIDGEFTNYNSADTIYTDHNLWVSNGVFDGWLKIDLKNIYTVDRISLFSRDNDEKNLYAGTERYIHYYLYASTYDIDAETLSPDSDEFITFGTLYDSSALDKDFYDDIIFNTPIQIQFIIFNVGDSITGDHSTHYAHLDELQVYEYQSTLPAIVPEPSSFILSSFAIIFISFIYRFRKF